MRVDGEEFPIQSIKPVSKDEFVFLLTNGRMSFGGLGYAKNTREYYNDKAPYEGELDDIKVWSRTLSTEDIRTLSYNSELVHACVDDHDFTCVRDKG